MISTPLALGLALGIHLFSAETGHLVETLPFQSNELGTAPIDDKTKASALNFIQLNDDSNFFAARYKLCKSTPEDFLCELFKDKKRSKTSTTDLLPANKITQYARKNKLKSIENTNLRQSIKAVAALSNNERKKVYNNLISDQEACSSPHFIAALAFKYEEQLPQQEALEKIQKLYKKAVDCSSESEISELALYRGGLIALWQKDIETAQNNFEKLKSSTDISYSARASFWINQIAKSKGEDILSEKLDASFQSFPLSYHIISDYAQMEEGPFEKISDLPDKNIAKRSSNEYVNQLVQYIEFFKENGKAHLAKKVLEFADYKQVEQAEPGVQLYIASVIAEYEDLNHQRFVMMSKLFQKYPDYKTVKNLQIFYPLLYDDLIVKFRKDQDPFIIMALMRQESSFNPNTRSPVGASGLMQIMPRTAKDIKKREVSVNELLNPQFNIEMGARYFSSLMREHQQDYMKALASYNAGSGNVRKWKKRYPVDNPLLFVDLIPFDETREYVAGILRNHYWYSKLYSNVIAKYELAGPISASK